MTNLCQLNHFSCFGCCGHDWKNKKDVLEQIMKNTQRWKDSDTDKFVKESEKHLSKSGGCKSLIFKDGRIICALHPMQNKGKDLRDKNCNINHFCRAFKEFIKWDKKTQKKFVDCLLNKDVDNYEFSMGMDSGDFLKEFKKVNNIR